MIIRLFSAVSALLLASVVTVSAFNHPELKWQSVTTDHFVINYYDRTEPVLYAAWKIAEEAYATLAPAYQYPEDRKIHISLADYDDYSNGWADWLSGTVMIWVPDARFELRGNPTWLRNVITHEIAHIMSLAQRRTRILDWSFMFSYTSPSVTAAYMGASPRMTMIPDWLAEGAAQLGAQRLGGDCWDSKRNMILRTAVRSGKQLSLVEMGHFNHDGRGNEMVYNQGYSLARHIASMVTPEVFDGMFVTAASQRFVFGDYFTAKTRVSLDKVYQLWLDSLSKVYQAQMPAEPTAVTPVWRKGFLNYLPRVSRDGAYWGWLTNHKDDGYRTDLIIAKTGSTRPVARIAWAQTSWDFSADGKSVYYIKARRTDRNGSFLNDIYQCRIDGRGEKRLTRGARVYDIAAASDGRTLACTRFERGRFGLFVFDVQERTWKVIDEGEVGAPFATPCYNPAAPGQLAVARAMEGNSDILVYDTHSGESRVLVSSTAQEESPWWGSDGRVYYSADHGGTYDVYSVDVSGNEPLRHSRMSDGAFFARPMPDGNIVCVDYSTSGYGVAVFAPLSETVAGSDTDACVFKGVPEPKGRVEIDGVPYRARMLKSYSELQTFIDVYADEPVDDSVRQSLAMAGMGLSFYRGDAVGKKWLWFGMYAGLQGGYYYPPIDTTQNSMSSGAQIDKARKIFDDAVSSPRRGLGVWLGPRRHNGQQSLWDTRYSALGDGSDTGSSDYVWFPPSLFIQPVLQFESAALRPTIGFTAMVAISMGGSIPIPSYIAAEPYLYWHIARDLYAGVSPYFEAMPLYGYYYLDVPVWLQYIRTGRIEQDLYYTMRDVLLVMVGAGPGLTPAVVGGDEVTTVGVAQGVISFAYGVPVAKSASLVIEADGSVVNGDEAFSTAELGTAGMSDIYVRGSLGASFIFPIVKTINRGTSLYLDALYGSIFYRGSIIGNRTFVYETSRNDILDVAGGAENDHGAATHTVGANVSMGTFKHYLFFRTLSLSGSYELVNRDVKVDVSFGF